MDRAVGPDEFASALIVLKARKDAETADAPIREHIPDPFSLEVSDGGLRSLVNLAWSASLRTDESRSVLVRLFLSRQPVHIGSHSFVLSPPAKLTSPSLLVRLSAVAPTSGCAIDVSESDGGLVVVGVTLDQHESAASHGTLQRYVRMSRTGWELQVLGPGHLRATASFLPRYVDLVDGHVRTPTEVVDVPPVRAWVDGVSRTASAPNAESRRLSPKAATDLHRSAWRLIADLLTSVVRTVSEARHGATIVITAAVDQPVLRGGYRSANAWPLSSALARLARVSTLEVVDPREPKIERDRVEKWLRAQEQLTAWAMMCTQLAQADGCVALDPSGRMLAFGLEIVTRDASPEGTVVDAGTGGEVDLREFGTRHRSAARFCEQDPSALAIVVSQDGGIRVFGRSGATGRVAIWRDVQAHFRAW